MSSYKSATSLDPNDIKQSLKDFLESQDEFTSYDFEGSGLSVILDLLSQNTYYLSFLANMLGNELTIDTSQIRSVIAAHAKRLSYTPHSRVAPKAIVDIEVTPDDIGSAPNTITLNKKTRFVTTIDDEVYYFINKDILTSVLSNGNYTFDDVELYQGRFLNIEYTATEAGERFEIPNDDVDINHITVRVQNSASSSTILPYSYAENLVSIDDDSLVYFLSENSKGRYEIEFGDGVLGKAIESGNIVKIEYMVTKGAPANGASSFDTVSTIANYSDISVNVTQKAYGGKERESDQSIKFNAPKKFYTQNRAVTASDYEPIVRQVIPQALDVKAWGGEDNNPPTYGTVYIALKMPSNVFLTQSAKETIARNNLKKFAVTSITPILVDADETILKIGLTVVYNKALLTSKTTELVNNIQNKVLDYSENNLEAFGSRFRASVMTKQIDETDQAIKNSFITSLDLYKTFRVVEGQNQSISIQFGSNRVKEGSLYIQGFRVADPTTTQIFGRIYYMRDVDGDINIYRNNEGTEVTIIEKVGSIDYQTGEINISNFTPLEADSELEIKVSPFYYDIEVVRGEVLEINDISNVTVTLEGE